MVGTPAIEPKFEVIIYPLLHALLRDVSVPDDVGLGYTRDEVDNRLSPFRSTIISWLLGKMAKKLGFLGSRILQGMPSIPNRRACFGLTCRRATCRRPTCWLMKKRVNMPRR